MLGAGEAEAERFLGLADQAARRARSVSSRFIKNLCLKNPGGDQLRRARDWLVAPTLMRRHKQLHTCDTHASGLALLSSFHVSHYHLFFFKGQVLIVGSIQKELVLSTAILTSDSILPKLTNPLSKQQITQNIRPIPNNRKNKWILLAGQNSYIQCQLTMMEHLGKSLIPEFWQVKIWTVTWPRCLLEVCVLINPTLAPTQGCQEIRLQSPCLAALLDQWLCYVLGITTDFAITRAHWCIFSSSSWCTTDNV